jgi:hypothetical protein
MNKRLSTALFVLISVAHASSQTVQQKSLSDKDKIAIMKLAFRDAVDPLVKDPNLSNCTLPIVRGKKVVLVQTDLKAGVPRSVGDYRLLIKSKDEIEAEIKSNDGDCYLRTGDFVTDASGGVTLNLSRWMVVVYVSPGRSFTSRWFRAQGRTYVATRDRGRWRIKFARGTSVVT